MHELKPDADLRPQNSALFSRKSEMNCAIWAHLRPHPLIYKWLSVVTHIIPVASHVSLSTTSGETQLVVKLFTAVYV